MRWNEVTWYSRIAAIILFLAVIPALCFYIGMQYGVVRYLEGQQPAMDARPIDHAGTTTTTRP